VQYILINFWCTAHYHCTVSSDTQKSSELLILDPIHPELNSYIHLGAHILAYLKHTYVHVCVCLDLQALAFSVSCIEKMQYPRRIAQLLTSVFLRSSPTTSSYITNNFRGVLLLRSCSVLLSNLPLLLFHPRHQRFKLVLRVCRTHTRKMR